MRLTSHLLTRNGHYFFRLRTPVDLLGIIHQAKIRKSLKITDLKTAKASALPYLQDIRQTVTLLRSRFISPDQAQKRLQGLLDWKLGRYGKRYRAELMLEAVKKVDYA